MKKRIKLVLYELQYMLCNYVIANIPVWAVRRLLYLAQGMKIGKKTRILMKTLVICPQRITVGDRSVINERCCLDGRGGITVGDDVSVSHHTKIITGSHDIHSPQFAYCTRPVRVEDNVFIGTGCILLGGAYLKRKCVIAAGSVCKNGEYEENIVYSGVPAVFLAERNLECGYRLGTWQPWFL